MIRLLFLIVFSINSLFFAALNSQTVSFIHFYSKNGLPSDLVYCGYQDYRGMLWFGTDKGMFRYDNKVIRLFTTHEGLPDPEVFNLVEDSNNRLWINSFRKKTCYVKYDTIYNIHKKSFLKKIDLRYGICDFYDDNGNSVWISNTTDIVYSVDGEKVNEYKLPSTIVQFHRIDSSLLAFGSGYIFECSDINNAKLVFDLVKELNGIPKYVGVCVSGNRFLYSFLEKLLLFEYQDGICTLIDRKDSIVGRVYTDRSGRFWVCSPSQGAICFDNKNRDLSNPKVYLPGKKTTTMFEDEQGTFWFCTLDDGIYGLPLGAPITYSKSDGLSSNNLVALARDSLGRILFGDDEGNMNILQNGRLSLERYSSTDGYNRLLGIYPISKTEIWVLTDEGVYIQYANGRREKAPTSGSPKAMLPDGDTVWCGTSAGLYTISRSKKTMRQQAGQRITAIEKDAEGVIWAGGIEGLYSATDSFQQNWGNRFPALQNRVIAIKQDKNRGLWVATPEHGLLRVATKNGRVVGVQPVNRLLKQPIQGIHSMYRDANGRLWIATNRGIYGLNPENWSVLRYNHHDGLANNDIKSIVVHNDTLWVASPSGLTRMLLSPLPAMGQFATYITAVRYRVNDRDNVIHVTDAPSRTNTTILPLNATLVEVDFAGLDYRSRGNLMFDCIISEELPPFQWITADHLIRWVSNGFRSKPDTTRLYKSSLDFGVSMPPGKFKLRVTALTQNDVYGRPSGEWSVVMPAHWYSTIWFTLLIWTSIGLLMYRFYRIRAKLREMALAVARFRLMALQAQINPHFIGNSINAIQRFFYPPDPTNASRYNSTFIAMLRKTLNFSEKTFIPFEEEIAYNKHYLEMARLRYGDNRFAYTITGTEDIPGDMPYPSLFLQPILENATIHGTAPSGLSIVRVHYTIHDGRLVCTITDNGPGLNVSKADQASRADNKRRSKGVEILRKKAATLNELFDIDLQMAVLDLADTYSKQRGTQAIVSFDVQKMQKAPRKQAKIDKYAVPSDH
jgi:ligand-binding sensor domain-containing protein